MSVNVRYEPFTIGDSRAIIKFTSPEGMEYSCLLYGKSTAPIPQVIISIIFLLNHRDQLNVLLEPNLLLLTLRIHSTKNVNSKSLLITLTSL